MARNPVIRYTAYLKKLLEDDDTRIEIGDVLRAYLRSRYLSHCAKIELKRIFKVREVFTHVIRDMEELRELARRTRSWYKPPVLVYSSIEYDRFSTIVGPATRHYLAVILSKAVVLMTVERVEPELGETIYFIKDKYKVIQA